MSYEKKVKIVLHGYLKDLYPADLYIVGSTPSEIINGMCKQTKAFNPKLGEDRHCISVVGLTSPQDYTQPIPVNMNEMHIVPAMMGGKSGSFFKIIIGAVLIAAAIYTGGTSLGAMTLFGSTTISGALMNFGISLVLGGLLEMLSPAPKTDQVGQTSVSDPEASKYIAANQNTVKMGTRIPLLYGYHRAYGHYISFDVDAVDVAV